MDINELCSYRIDCYGCPRENDCAFLKKKTNKTNKTNKNMTIRDLCHKFPICDSCPFNRVCSDALGNFSDDRNNEEVTKAIIETAKMLQEVNNDD